MTRWRSDRLAAAVLGVCAMLTATTANASAGDCRRTPVLTATCFSMRRVGGGCPAQSPPPCRVIHARLHGTNGTPALRLSASGSRRILGVFGGDGGAESPDLLPPNVATAMAPPSPGDLMPVSGDFRVCPLALQKAGWMQPVCIASASRLTAARRRD